MWKMFALFLHVTDSAFGTESTGAIKITLTEAKYLLEKI